MKDFSKRFEAEPRRSEGWAKTALNNHAMKHPVLFGILTPSDFEAKSCKSRNANT